MTIVVVACGRLLSGMRSRFLKRSKWNGFYWDWTLRPYWNRRQYRWRNWPLCTMSGGRPRRSVTGSSPTCWVPGPCYGARRRNWFARRRMGCCWPTMRCGAWFTGPWRESAGVRANYPSCMRYGRCSVVTHPSVFPRTGADGRIHRGGPLGAMRLETWTEETESGEAEDERIPAPEARTDTASSPFLGA